jgi:NitT/TauT family transport system substrate-binding protein
LHDQKEDNGVLNCKVWIVGIGLLVAGAAVGCGSSSAASPSAGGKQLTTVTYVTSGAGPEQIIENVVIGEELGYFAQQGIAPKFVYTGSNQATTADMTDGKAQLGYGSASYMIGLAATGQTPGIVNYYEYSYPGKYSIIVAPNSKITSLAQLKGKSVGIVSLGLGDTALLEGELTNAGINPSSVHIEAVGQGTAAGHALDDGQIDAYLAWDTVRGEFDLAGIKYRVLVPPQDIPKIAGSFIAATPAYLKAHAKIAIGFARAVAEATVFTVTNPRAAAALYLKMYPNTATDEPLTEQVSQAVTEAQLRVDHLLPYADPTKIGYIQPSEWQNELRFDPGGNKVSSPTPYYTNTLISQIDDFNVQAIEASAKAYKIAGA